MSSLARSQLAAYLDRIGHQRSIWQLVHIRISALQPFNRPVAHTRLAVEAFRTVIQPYEGWLFQMANQDLVYVWANKSREDMDRVLDKLRYFFSEDPLCRSAAQGAPHVAGSGFAVWYDLATDLQAALALAHSFPDDVPEKSGTVEFRAAADAGSGRSAELSALNPAKLDQLLDTMKQTDLVRFVERQPICVILPGRAPVPVLQECFVSISELQKSLIPGVDLLSSRWLFQHLTEALDRRMLRLLRDSSYIPDEARFSLNLNVSTVLSDDFGRFDRSRADDGKATVAVEFQMADVFADIAAFHLARQFLMEKGYRTVIDGITHETLPLVDRATLQVDLMKIFWSLELADALAGSGGDRLRGLIAAAGPDRVILCRCDDVQAIEAGTAMGIHMFQGRHVDTMLLHAGDDTDPVQTVSPQARAS